MRAVVIVTENTEKGTSRNGQEYIDPLLTLGGEQYANLSFQELHDLICDALHGGRPAVTLEFIDPDGNVTVYLEDGTSRRINRSDN